jgi:hypothetical protein
MLGECDALCARPAAQRGGDGLVLEVARQMVMVGFDRDRFANEPRGDGIRSAITTQGESSRDFGVGRITTIRSQRWEGAHGLRGKPLDGRLAGSRVDADIGHLVAPLIGVGLEIGAVSEGPQRPKVVPAIVAGALLHLALFLGLGHIAGDGGNLQGPQKRQKLLVEPHQRALPLQDCGAQVVMDEFFGGALEKVTGIEEAAVQGVLPL